MESYDPLVDFMWELSQPSTDGCKDLAVLLQTTLMLKTLKKKE